MSLRDIFAERGLPEATFPLRRVSSQVLVEAEEELRSASAALLVAEADRTVSTAHRTRVDDAVNRVRDCYTFLTVRALPPAEMEDLIAQHPAPEGKPGELFDRKTLMPILLERCVFDSPESQEFALSAEEWEQQITKGSGSAGEIGALFHAVWNVNDRAPDVNLPKGSTRTNS